MTIVLSDRVAGALRVGDPVVALESTIITHGLPRPDNLQAALEFERAVADGGAVPATIAVLDGVPHVGLDDGELERLAGTDGALKLSGRDLPVAMARGGTGGTTVAATTLLAWRAGIRVFATGGIGGVHRDAGSTFDESADLGVLGSCRITVVSGGVKSILDIGATLERLETLGVTVLVFGTERFPAFWLTDSGYKVDFSVTSAEEIAEVMRAADTLDLPGGMLVANPLPEAAQLDPAVHDRLLADALRAADAASIRGKGITPFLLDYIHEHTGGASVGVNLDIVRGNCRLGAAIARAWSSLRLDSPPGSDGSQRVIRNG
ncbi:MAG TPA: pseudouridine-5'-phosphate glycosidase [Solirubrobacteraceae bacterium]|nr:pseudouridine-5'-phosphate glycosidase [Solirubrobacteraceae bacterium]